jgi:hypothetical protein
MKKSFIQKNQGEIWRWGIAVGLGQLFTNIEWIRLLIASLLTQADSLGKTVVNFF